MSDLIAFKMKTLSVVKSGDFDTTSTSKVEVTNFNITPPKTEGGNWLLTQNIWMIADITAGFAAAQTPRGEIRKGTGPTKTYEDTFYVRQGDTEFRNKVTQNQDISGIADGEKVTVWMNSQANTGHASRIEGTNSSLEVVTYG